MSKLAAALAGGGRDAYRDAYDSEAQLQTNLARALASVRQADAQADYDTARAEGERAKTGILGRRHDLFEEQVANASGLDIPTVRARREQLRTGQAPQVPMGPEAPDGSMGVGSLQLGPQSGPKLSAALQQFLPLLSNSGDLKPDDLAKSAETFRTMGLSDRVLSGELKPGDVGAAQAAAGGKALFNSDSNGAVLNLFSGALDESGGLAQNNIKLLGAKQASEKALQTERYASAEQHRSAAAESRARVQKIAAELQAGTVGGMTDPKARFEAENKLRDEYQKGSQTFVLIRDALGKVQAAAKDPSPAGDIAMIFAYMKILDPTSVVREGEFATAQNAASIPDQVRNAYNRALQGTRLNPQQRIDFTNQAKKVFEEQKKGQDLNVSNYTRLAKNYGLSVDNIVTPYTVPEAQPPRQGGASGGWGDAPAAPAGRNVVVNY
jgi:hypothetical protein